MTSMELSTIEAEVTIEGASPLVVKTQILRFDFTSILEMEEALGIELPIKKITKIYLNLENEEEEIYPLLIEALGIKKDEKIKKALWVHLLQELKGDVAKEWFCDGWTSINGLKCKLVLDYRKELAQEEAEATTVPDLDRDLISEIVKEEIKERSANQKSDDVKRSIPTVIPTSYEAGRIQALVRSLLELDEWSTEKKDELIGYMEAGKWWPDCCQDWRLKSWTLSSLQP